MCSLQRNTPFRIVLPVAGVGGGGGVGGLGLVEEGEGE